MGGEPGFVFPIAIAVAVGLTLLSVAALMYFFHHVAVSIQPSKLVAAVAAEPSQAIDTHTLSAWRGAER